MVPVPTLLAYAGLFTAFFISVSEPFVKFSDGCTPSKNSFLLSLASASKSSLLIMEISRLSVA